MASENILRRPADELRELISGRLREEVEWFARKRLKRRQQQLFIDWLHCPDSPCRDRVVSLALRCSVRTAQRDLLAAIERMIEALCEQKEGRVQTHVTILISGDYKSIQDSTLVAALEELQEI